ncbi:MAG TPA: nucleotidyltransferase domain-containing protein [Pseudonocardiaceae bacterium]|nr:nucleotidyltransferase domain-containing protein [Pseudonocardiaceae bacterium]
MTKFVVFDTETAIKDYPGIMLSEVEGGPIGAARRLREAAVDGRLEALAEAHGLSLVVLFGSASRGEPDARDLDVAVGSRERARIDMIEVICALMELAEYDSVDLLDLDRAGPVACQRALVPGDPLYEYRRGSSPGSRCGRAGNGWAPSGCDSWILP